MPGAKYCIKCGRKLPEKQNLIKCVNCGTLVRDNEKFCYKCGFPINKDKEQHFAVFLAPDAEQKICQICFKPIKKDLTFCPNCLNPFHIPHLYSWVRKEGTCPVCKTRLIIQE